MAFCPKCGQQIDDSAVNCPFCGAANSNNSNANSPVNDITEKIKKLNVKNIAMLAAGVVVVILVIVLLSSLFGGGYKKAIDRYYDAVYFGKKAAIENLAPKEVWDWIEDEYDVDKAEVVEYLQEASEDRIEVLEDEYGKNIKFSFKVTDKDTADKDDLKELRDELKEWDIPKKKVKKALEVEFDYTIKGKEDKDEDDSEVGVVKIGSKWYSYNGIYMIVSAAREINWENEDSGDYAYPMGY